MDLEKDTVGFGIMSGPSSTELLQVHFEVELSKYESAVSWLKTMLYDFVLDEERLHASLSKILADIPDEKREGSSMSASLQNMTEYTRESSIKACDTLVKSRYLKRVKALLRKEPQKVIDQLQEIADILHQTDNYRVYVAADLTKLESPVSTWKSFLRENDSTKPLRPIPDIKTMLSDAGKHPGNNAIIEPLPTVDSAFARFSTRGPDSFDHPDLPAIMVAEAYLDAVEGPLWVAVRGSGLAYGAGHRRSISSGMITYKLYRAAECFKAFLASKEQVEGLASGSRGCHLNHRTRLCGRAANCSISSCGQLQQPNHSRHQQGLERSDAEKGARCWRRAGEGNAAQVFHEAVRSCSGESVHHLCADHAGGMSKFLCC